MDCVEEDLRIAIVTKFGKTSGRQRMTLCDIAEDREQWRELVALASMAESSWTMKTDILPLCSLYAANLLCIFFCGANIPRFVFPQ